MLCIVLKHNSSHLLLPSGKNVHEATYSSSIWVSHDLHAGPVLVTAYSLAMMEIAFRRFIVNLEATGAPYTLDRQECIQLGVESCSYANAVAVKFR